VPFWFSTFAPHGISPSLARGAVLVKV